MFFDDSPLSKKRAGKNKPALLDLSKIEYKLTDFVPFTDDELLAAVGKTLVFDAECYEDYWLIAFRCVESGKIVYFEVTPESKPNYRKLMWVMTSFRIIGFNSKNYDIPMIWLAMTGVSTSVLKDWSDRLIIQNVRPDELYEAIKIAPPKINHIDLIEVAPLKASLKKYGGRLHTRSLQDLPFPINMRLGDYRYGIVRHYCINDLHITYDLYVELIPQLELRDQLSAKYDIDVRSKSDAQIAEAVIGAEIKKRTGNHPKRPEIKPGTKFRYKVPDGVFFRTPRLQELLERIRNTDFEVAESGKVLLPPSISEFDIHIGNARYQVGNGGLHSQEKCQALVADAHNLICDVDVASYYPKLILNQRLYPSHIGPVFLDVFQELVDMRLAAKKAKNNVVADSVKIVINGSFGKLGSKYSMLNSPDLMIQVTISGQLCLLMLIEYLESVGIRVVSANTDGIVIYCPVERYADMKAIVASWEKHLSLEMEETQYAAIYSRDVNNYIAVKKKFDREKGLWLNEIDGCKGKGAYANHWKGSDRNIFKLHKNPQTTICIEAAIATLTTGKPYAKTIAECEDITKFVAVRDVKGGGAKDGINLGKVVRWYYSENETGEIQYITNGNKVPKSLGARPLMEMPDSVPADLNRAWYEDETKSILMDIGFIPKPNSATLF